MFHVAQASLRLDYYDTEAASIYIYIYTHISVTQLEFYNSKPV